MKHALLLLIILPIGLFARHEDPRVRQEAPYAGLKSVKTTTLFTLPKEGNKLDTCIKETHLYNQDGLLIQHDFAMVMQKNPRYDYQEKFVYSAEDAWVKHVYKRGILSDSTSVNGSWANEYYYKEGKIATLYKFRTDSLGEMDIQNGDTIIRHWGVNKISERDEFWDITCKVNFANKTVSKLVNGRDTTTYLDANGEGLVRYINHYNSEGKVVQTDYYNYQVKTFILERLVYSDKMDMSFFLHKNRNGQWSYQKLFRYNDKGQLIEEQWIEAKPKQNNVVIRYEYEFYN